MTVCVCHRFWDSDHDTYLWCFRLSIQARRWLNLPTLYTRSEWWQRIAQDDQDLQSHVPVLLVGRPAVRIRYNPVCFLGE